MKQNFKIFMTISIFLCLFAFTGCGSVGVAIVDTDGQKTFYEDSLEKGESYISGGIYTVPANDFIYIIANTTDKNINMYQRKIQIESQIDVDVLVELYENASFTDGVKVQNFNKNRNKADNSTLQIYSIDTVNVDLTNAEQLPMINIIKGSKGLVSQTSEFADYIMKKNNTYALKITNNNPQPANLYFAWNWLEPQDKITTTTNTALLSSNLLPCVLDGQNIKSGFSGMFYSSTSGDCNAETRICNNGVLSGDTSFLHSSCAVTSSGTSDTTNELPDTTPILFSIPTSNEAEELSIVSSNIIPITGINRAVTISVTGTGNPQIRVCSTSTCSIESQGWNSANIVLNAQYIQVRQTSGVGLAKSTTATITAGDLSARTWTARTKTFKHTFTTCGKTGQSGPTLATCRSAYSSTNWETDSYKFNVISGIQYWRVPESGSYRITSKGAMGGKGKEFFGGGGASMTGTFTLSKGENIKILVGQKGTDHPSHKAGGGGGGTFVVTESATKLVIAGGGSGGGGNTNPQTGLAGVTGNSGTHGSTLSSGAGINGKGGTLANGGYNSAGGGYSTSGQASTMTAMPNNHGKGFLQGGKGGDGATCTAGGGAGGFGGGSGGEWCQNGATGAGGGYSGGGGTGNNGVAGAGGSYNVGSSQSNSGGANADHGKVIIEYLG